MFYCLLIPFLDIITPVITTQIACDVNCVHAKSMKNKSGKKPQRVFY